MYNKHIGVRAMLTIGQLKFSWIGSDEFMSKNAPIFLESAFAVFLRLCSVV